MWNCVEHRLSNRAYTSSVKRFLGRVGCRRRWCLVGNFSSYVICLRRYESPVFNVGLIFLISFVFVPCQDLGQTVSCVECHNSVLSRSTAPLLPVVRLRDSCLRKVGVPKGVAFEFVKRAKQLTMYDFDFLYGFYNAESQ